MNYIFITGGVMSSIGKGIIASCIASILKLKGYDVLVRKIEPYLNVDSGTLNPDEHGEVFVTDDGAETDLDLGTYERFTQNNTCKDDIMTTGSIYQELISRERKGDLLGRTIQVVPHVTNLIREKILNHEKKDFVIYEIGGTVGDIESLHFIEAISKMQYYTRSNIFIHVGWAPHLSHTGEWKTKPIQHSVSTIRKMGINPDIIICRSEESVPESNLCKIQELIYGRKDLNNIFSLPNVKNIYRVPEMCIPLVNKIEKLSGNEPKECCNIWNKIAEKYENRGGKPIRIAILQKYSQNSDTYKSLVEAIKHASIHIGRIVDIEYINSNEQALSNIDGIIIPGGFGFRRTEDMMQNIEEARNKKIPTLGICLGFQLMVIEFCKNVLLIKDATSEEFTNDGTHVIKKYSKTTNLGGTMRLGLKKCILKDHTMISEIYSSTEILERHRHRYDVSQEIRPKLLENGMIISGLSDDKEYQIVESIELKDQFFIGVQYHPEFISRPDKPHCIFVKFLEYIIKQEIQ